MHTANQKTPIPPVHDLHHALQRAHELAALPGAPPAPPKLPDGVGALDALAEGLRDHVPTTRLDVPVAALLPSLSARRPVYTVGAHGGYVLLRDRRGGRVLVEDALNREWLTTSQLLTRLGLPSDGAVFSFLGLDFEAPPSVPIGADDSPWRAAWHLIDAERDNLGTIFIYAVGVGLLSLALPLAVQTLVNTVAFGQLLQPIVVLTLLLAGGLIFAAALRAMQAYMVEVVQRRVFVGLVAQIGDRLPRVHVTAFERGHGPELVNRFFDVFTAQKAVASLLLGGVEALLTALVGLIVLAFYHPLLLGFGALLIASVAVVFFLLGRGATYSTVAESKAKYAVAGWLEEMARHVFALKMSGGASYAQQRLDGLAADWLRYRDSHFRIYFRQLLGALALQVIAHATLLGIGGWLVIERELTVGQLVAAELIVTAVVASLSKLGTKLETVYDLVAAADKLSALLKIPVEPDAGELSMMADDEPAQVSLRDVSTHSGRLRDLSLNVPAGSSMALTGDRPARRELVELLFGLRAPNSGLLTIDRHDLRDVALRSLRGRVAVVREPEPLPDTIAANVRASGGELPALAIWDLLDQVGLGETVRAMPEGLRTRMVPSGAPLDRIDQMRLTLARALASRPGLLILDGVLDALPHNERVDLVHRLSSCATVVITTDCPDVIGACDQSLALGSTTPEETLVA